MFAKEFKSFKVFNNDSLQYGMVIVAGLSVAFFDQGSGAICSKFGGGPLAPENIEGPNQWNIV